MDKTFYLSFQDFEVLLISDCFYDFFLSSIWNPILNLSQDEKVKLFGNADKNKAMRLALVVET